MGGVTAYANRLLRAAIGLVLPVGWELTNDATETQVIRDGHEYVFMIGVRVRQQVAPPIINVEHLRRK